MSVAAIVLAAVVAATQPSLAKLVLKPSAVGMGFVELQRTDGHGTAERTLDLCGVKNYPSENLRVERLQVNYLRQNTPLYLSNEVVTYRAGGAAQAMREVAQHAANCPNKPIAFEGQPPLTYKVTRISDSKLLPGAIAIRVDVSGKIKGKKVSAVRFAVYQRSGDTLSGVYSYVIGNGVPADEQEAFLLHAAEASAKTLRGTAASKGPAA
jgi:hypothetical protein